MSTDIGKRIDPPATGIGAPSRPQRRRRYGRWLIALGVVLLLLMVAVVGTAWYYSDQLLDVTHGPNHYTVSVLALHPHSITLGRTTDTARNGVFGLQWPHGEATIGTILASTSTSVTRRLSGPTAGLHGVSDVRIDIGVYQSPAAAGLSYRNVFVPDALGPMPAWYVAGRRHTWILLVHGYGSDRTDGIRPMRTLARLGFPILDLSYRNDVGAPSSSDHLYHLGATEWQDVEAGARYAVAHGARSFVLYGYSMGGNVVEDFLHRASDASRVRAVVLDAPVLDWTSPLGLAASQKHLPGFVTTIAERIVAYRLGLSSLDDINAVKAAGSLRAPTLIFHGTQDDRVPIGPSEALARARPKLVTLITVPGASHIEAWNVNRAAYDSRLSAFLTRVLG